jgi:hypothetical protein
LSSNIFSGGFVHEIQSIARHAARDSDSGYSYPGLTPGDSIDACTSAGSNVTSVHTPYGDVDVCKFPNGNIMDLFGLYNGIQGDNWYNYAYNYLNAP